MRTLPLLLTIFAISLTPLPLLRGIERLNISLKEQASVASTTVLLGDVADLSGSEAGRLEQLARLPVSAAPSPGFVLSLNRNQVQQKIKTALGTAADFDILGAATVQVKLQSRTVQADEILSLLKDQLLETTAWKESEIEIRTIGGLESVELPPGEVALLIPQKTTPSGSMSMLVPIEVILEGKPYKIFWINVDLRIRANVLQAARKIPYGKTITQEDIREAIVEIADARIACLRKPEDAIGKISRRTLSPGDPLTRESLTNPFLIRSGETVHLRLERNGIQVATLARAEQDGKLGQTIRIRNLDFARLLKAQVVGRGEVKIE